MSLPQDHFVPPPQRGGSQRRRGFYIRVGGDELAPRQARRELAALRGELDPMLLDTTQLLVTEVVTNAVRHAGAEAIELEVDVDRSRIRVEVANEGAPFTPRPRDEIDDPEPGWGLYLVDELSDDWGVQGEHGRQRVWFELARG